MTGRDRPAARRGRCVARGLALLLLVACGPGPATRPSSAVTPSLQPATRAETAGPTGSLDWEATQAAARQEGRVVVSGAPGQVWREALSAFQQDYPDVAVEYTGVNGRDFWPRAVQERGADQFLWDVRVGGGDALLYEMKSQGLLDPLPPLLVRPDVTDDGKWLGGLNAGFLDQERQYALGFLANVQNSTWVNRDLVRESDLSASRDLLDPRWRGKIVLQEPRGGSGAAQLTLLLAVYGESFVRQLLTQQDVAITGDNRQQAEWVVRGRYPIGIGVGDDQLLAFREQGLGTNVKPLTEPVGVSAGFGNVSAINRGPHPNATKLFVNWLLSRETQERLAPQVQYNSRRLDVPAVAAAKLPEASRLADYVPYQAEQLLPELQRVQELVRELVP